MGETADGTRMSFNGSVRVEIGDDHTSSDGGSLALREMLQASGRCSKRAGYATCGTGIH